MIQSNSRTIIDGCTTIVYQYNIPVIVELSLQLPVHIIGQHNMNQQQTPNNMHQSTKYTHVKLLVCLLCLLLLLLLLICLYCAIRPVHLSRVSLLRVLESNFPGDTLSNSTDMGIPTPYNEESACVKPSETQTLNRRTGRTTDK